MTNATIPAAPAASATPIPPAMCAFAPLRDTVAEAAEADVVEAYELERGVVVVPVRV